MKKFQSLGKLLTKDEQVRIKGGCTPEQMCDPDDVQACGGLTTCHCPQRQGSFQCCVVAIAACVINHGCFAVGFSCVH